MCIRDRSISVPSRQMMVSIGVAAAYAAASSAAASLAIWYRLLMLVIST